LALSLNTKKRNSEGDGKYLNSRLKMVDKSSTAPLIKDCLFGNSVIKGILPKEGIKWYFWLFILGFQLLMVIKKDDDKGE